ncbi:MAG: hypothetical protein RLZZ511_2071 [Cyanobacteriota bacterium]|jgi:hypothetical protein
MPRHQSFNLPMQLARMYRDGQSFFAKIKVEEWLRARHEDPNDYDITLTAQPSAPGASDPIQVIVELRRRDGAPVEPWLLEALNDH